MTPTEKADAAKAVVEVVEALPGYKANYLNDVADVLAMAAKAFLPGYDFTVIIEQKRP